LRNTTLLNALARAYELKFGAYLIDGPSWIKTERYEIVAKAPANAPREQIPLMLRTLLVERFKLQLHHEQRELPAYELHAGKTRLKSKEDDSGPKDTFTMDHGREARNMSMNGLAQYLSMTLRAPVLDKTNLGGFYDFPYELSAEESADTSGAKPSIFTIVESLGLKLRAEKASFDVIVVDSGNKVPTEN
jgi:uncharacterized protein (TIGR03435 family)